MLDIIERAEVANANGEINKAIHRGLTFRVATATMEEMRGLSKKKP